MASQAIKRWMDRKEKVKGYSDGGVVQYSGPGTPGYMQLMQPPDATSDFGGGKKSGNFIDMMGNDEGEGSSGDKKAPFAKFMGGMFKGGWAGKAEKKSQEPFDKEDLHGGSGVMIHSMQWMEDKDEQVKPSLAEAIQKRRKRG